MTEHKALPPQENENVETLSRLPKWCQRILSLLKEVEFESQGRNSRGRSISSSALTREQDE